MLSVVRICLCCHVYLAQSVATVSVGILIDDSAQQLWVFCCLQFVTGIVLVLFKPFTNRWGTPF